MVQMSSGRVLRLARTASGAACDGTAPETVVVDVGAAEDGPLETAAAFRLLFLFEVMFEPAFPSPLKAA
jgi:hypothetical protein